MLTHVMIVILELTFTRKIGYQLQIRGNSENAYVSMSTGNLATILIIFIVEVCLYLYSNVYMWPVSVYFVKEMMKYPILGLFFFSLLGSLLAMNENHFVNRILSGKILQFLGRISYGIYVWHLLALKILSSLFISNILILDFMLAFSLTIMLAYLSYYYFERYFLILKDKKITWTDLLPKNRVV